MSYIYSVTDEMTKITRYVTALGLAHAATLQGIDDEAFITLFHLAPGGTMILAGLIITRKS